MIWWGKAISLGVTALFTVAPIQPALAQTAVPPAVYLDRYLGTTAVQAESGRFTARSLTLNGERLRAWVTEVGAAGSERIAAVSLAVNGFDKFQATIGRDDGETGRGPGLVYFELWGDDKLLSRSAPIASNRHPVRVGAGAGLRVRRSPEQMEVSVRGVRRLRLITRYASDIEQQAPQVAQARGCVWGDVRLVPAAPSGFGGRGAVVVDPARDALRIGVIRLTSAVLAIVGAGEDGGTPDLALPLKAGVMPLQIKGRPQTDQPTETLVRAGLEELLAGARVQSRPVFTTLERREANRLADVRSEPDDTATLTAAGRRAGVDVVISGVYTPGQSIGLTATLVRTGKPFAQITIPIAVP